MNKYVISICVVAAGLLAGCEKPAPVVVQPVQPAPSTVIVTPPATDNAKASADKAADAANDATRAAEKSKDAAVDAKGSASQASDAAAEAKK